MNRIVILYSHTNTKGSILKDITNENIEILTRNKDKIELKSNRIIFKRANVNRANDLCKYKDDLILYYPGLEKVVNELKERCTIKLKFAEMSPISCKGVIPYIIKDSSVLQQRYFVGDGIFSLLVMVNESEKYSRAIANENLMWGKNLYLNKLDAVNDYRESLKTAIKRVNKEKEDLEQEHLKKISEMDSTIESYRNLIKNPEFKVLNSLYSTKK